MIRKLVVVGFLSALSLLVNCVTYADTLAYYDLSGPVTVTFYLPEAPAVDPDNADAGYGFSLTPIDLTLNGVSSGDFLTFYNDSLGGGFAAFSSDINADVSVAGPQLYSGSEFNPTMQLPELQPITLSDFNDPDIYYSLTVTAVTPELPGLVLLSAALALLGGVWKLKSFSETPSRT